ncbi:MAG: hypothetical protein K2Y01_06770 [Rhabdochlamydiaceae bacterium]|nr:hypothetical protein [Rhabdochlamydiaceae bacterium]
MRKIHLTALSFLFLPTSFVLADAPGNLSPSVKDNSAGMSVNLEFLWWTPSENTQPYAQVVTTEDVVGVSLDTSGYPSGYNQSLDLNWAPGFHVGLGWDTKRDHWDLLLDWTCYYNHTKKTKTFATHSATDTNTGLSGSENGIGIYGTWLGEWFPSGAADFLDEVPIQLVSPGPFSSAESSWTLHYNVVDLKAGRGFLSKYNLFKPFFGIQSAFIKRTLSVNYTGYANLGSLLTFVPTYNGFSNGSYNGSMHFSGLGPTFGFFDQVKLPYHMHLFGGFAASLLYGSMIGEDSFSLSNLVAGTSTPFGGGSFNDKNSWIPATHLQLQLGLGWKFLFSENSMFLDFGAAWESNLWMFNNFHNSVNEGTTQITLQGLTAFTTFGF